MKSRIALSVLFVLIAVTAFAADAAAPPTPIEEGEDKLTVTVLARFELTQ